MIPKPGADFFLAPSGLETQVMHPTKKQTNKKRINQAITFTDNPTWQSKAAKGTILFSDVSRHTAERAQPCADLPWTVTGGALHAIGVKTHCQSHLIARTRVS